MISVAADPVIELEAVFVAAAGLTQADEDLHAAVARARTAGASWAAIGRTLHVSRQAAWERFHLSTQKAQP